MSAAEWDNEYARLARAASQLRTQGFSGATEQTKSSLQMNLQRLDADLMKLNLPAHEVQRRRRLVQHLQQQAAAAASPGSNNAGAAATQPPQQQSQMAMAMQQQDDMIDQLAVGVGRLKTQTQAIGEEANLHVNLMNDMEGGLDSAYQGLEDETRRAARLREDQSIWKLQLTVAGLSVLLVLLIFTGLTP